MQNQIRLPKENRLLENANLRARLVETLAEIASRIDMRGEAAGIDMNSSISTESAISGKIYIKAVANNEEAAEELIGDLLNEEAVL